MDIKELFRYYLNRKWIIIISFILCIGCSLVFTYFGPDSYVTRNTLVLGPQSVLPDQDPKFRDKLLYIISDMFSSEPTASALSQATGLSLKKGDLTGMVSTLVNDIYQRLDFTIKGQDEETVALIGKKLPDIVKTQAAQYGISNMTLLDPVTVSLDTKGYKRNALAGGLGGLGLGVLIVFVLLVYDERFKDRHGIKRLFAIDYLGDENSQHRVSVAKFLLKARSHNARVVTNLIAGKIPDSRYLHHIGRYIAALGKQVLVIDLTGPSANGPEKQSGAGLTNLLAEHSDDYAAKAASLITRGEAESLFLLPYGTGPALDFSALLDGSFKTLVGQLKPDYELILINAPISMGIDQILLVAEASEGTVLEVQEGNITIPEAGGIISNLLEMDITILGYYTTP